VFSADAMSKVLENVPTAAKKALVSKCFGEIGYAARPKLVGDEAKIGELLANTGEDGAGFVESMDDVTLQKMFSISSDELDPKLMSELRANLVELNKQGISSSDINNFIDNVDKLKNMNGIKKVVIRISLGWKAQKK
jgi:hypothetical protein